MAKSTRTRSSGSRAPAQRRPAAGKSPAAAARRKRPGNPRDAAAEGARARDAEADAALARDEAEAGAALARGEAEEHARRLVLDARAAADGVRAEGMELVLSLRQISDALREGAERLLADIEAVHARMVGELEAADPVPSAGDSEPDSGEALEVPEFISRG